MVTGSKPTSTKKVRDVVPYSAVGLVSIYSCGLGFNLQLWAWFQSTAVGLVSIYSCGLGFNLQLWAWFQFNLIQLSQVQNQPTQKLHMQYH